MSLVKKRMAEIHDTMTTAESLVTQIMEKTVSSQNYSEISDVIGLLEIYEATLREKRQLMSLRLRNYYMNQVMDLHRKKPFKAIIIEE
jgi:hypothetical protein